MQTQNEVVHHPIKTQKSVSWWKGIRGACVRFWCRACCRDFCEDVVKNKCVECCDVDRVKQPRGQFVSLLSARMVDRERKVMSSSLGRHVILGMQEYWHKRRKMLISSIKHVLVQGGNKPADPVLSLYLWCRTDVRLHQGSIGKSGECDRAMEDFLQTWFCFRAYITFVHISVNAWVHVFNKVDVNGKHCQQSGTMTSGRFYIDALHTWQSRYLPCVVLFMCLTDIF